MNKILFIKNLIKMVGSTGLGAKVMLSQMDSHLYKMIVENGLQPPLKVRELKYEFVSSLLHSTMKNYRKGYISPHVIDKLLEVMVENSFFKDTDELVKAKEEFMKANGYYAPSFITLSPTKHCNLICTGCYACSNKKTADTLNFEIVDRICREVHDIFGSRFIVISGGEPFMYKSNGKTLLDIFRKYNDMFFLVYTNGTLITKDVAKELSELGNITPAVSVEGYEKETDARRGKGVYKKIMQAFGNMQKAGVPFGISVTATNKNTEILLSDDFYEYYFDTLGATYMWQFQFFPIGRGHEIFGLVVPPEDRIRLYHVWEKQINYKKRCIADFWNSGALTDGCIAYGRKGGYIYINWNGDIMPCVFVPYTVNNIIDLYSDGKTIKDALESDMMKRGRKWQISYKIKKQGIPGNILMPCSIRDHYANFRQNILTKDAKGENAEAQAILNDTGYLLRMVDYERGLDKLSSPIWKKYCARP